MIYLKTVLIVLALLVGWLTVRAIAQRFAARHPEFGALREDGAGGCGCRNHQCSKKTQCSK